MKLSTLSGNCFLPSFFVKGEFAFLIEMLSGAIGQRVIPLDMTVTFHIENQQTAQAFGAIPSKKLYNSITFSIQDLQKPFLSGNTSLLSCLEPELEKRLIQLEADDSFTRKVRLLLIELLPRGIVSADAAADQLGMSRRSMQRKLSTEKTSYQRLLNTTRELLAKNYLISTDLTADEIAFLLAYQETNSFLRAFCGWTGESVQQYRKRMQHPAD